MSKKLPIWVAATLIVLSILCGYVLGNPDLLGESLSENEEFVIDGINYLVNIKLPQK